MPQHDLIIDCQYGSTGKGLYAGYLAFKRKPSVIAFAPSPNAGHTLLLGEHSFIHKMLPTGITSSALQTVCLGPGSLLDLDRLQVELAHLRGVLPRMHDLQVVVHRNAACVFDRHRKAESAGGTAPGSTRQGVGAAQIERIRRNPSESNLITQADHPVLESLRLTTTQEMQQIYFEADRLQIESCQGYSLSIYHGDYPHCTSRDVTTASILSDTGVPWSRGLNVYGTFRTYPIRVANRPADGEHSGPCYPDSQEISFESIGQRQELTTVTKLPRRIFTWSQRQAIEACAQNHVTHAFLNFAQYPPTFDDLIDIWERLSECTNVTHLGFGPHLTDIHRVGSPSITRNHIEHLYHAYRN